MSESGPDSGPAGVFSVAAALTGIALAIAAQRLYVHPTLLVPACVLVAGGLLTSLSLRRFGLPIPSLADEAVAPSRPTAARLAAGIVAGVAGIALTGAALGAFAAPERRGWGWPLHLASVAGLVVAGFLLSPRGGGRRLPPLGLGVLATLGVILVVAAGLRFYRLEALPPGCWWDEANNGLSALGLLRPGTEGVVYLGDTLLPSHSFYLLAWGMKLLGPTLLALRSVIAASGVLAALFAFLLGRETLGDRFGLFAAALLAVGRWSVTLSRISLVSHLAATAVLAALWLLFRARRTGALSDAVLAGVTLGWGLCLYYSFRLFVFPFVAFLVIWLAAAVKRRGTAAGPARFGVLTAAICVSGLVAVAPLAQFAMKNWEAFASRTGTVSIFSHRDEPDLTKALVDNTKKHLAMLHFAGDRNGRHNLPGAPMLDEVTGALVIGGAFLALLRWNGGAGAIFLTTALTGLLGGILSVDFEAPQSLRSIGAMPAVFLLGALALDTLCNALRSRGGTGRALSLVLGTVALGAALVLNVQRYFLVQMENEDVFLEHSAPESLAGRRIAGAPASANLYASLFVHEHVVVRFLAPGVHTTRLSSTALPLAEKGERDAILVLDEGSAFLVDQAKSLYPHARVEEDRSPGGRTLIRTLYVPKADLKAVSGLVETRDAAGKLTRLSGILRVPRYGRYRFHVVESEADVNSGGTRLEVRGRAVPLDVSGLAEACHLPEGLVSFDLAFSPRDAAPRLLWAPPAASGADVPLPEQPIPETSLFRAPVEVHGLHARFFRGKEKKADADLERVEPLLDTYFHETPLPRPYFGVFSGTLDVPSSGLWTFTLRLRGHATVILDGNEILVAPEPGDGIGAIASLEKGPHALEVRFLDDLDASRLHLSWKPEGGESVPIPTNALRPD